VKAAVGRLGRRAVKVASLAGDRVAPPPRGAVVLAYHQVGAPGRSGVNIDPAAFADQMAWLASEARPTTLDDAVEALGAPSRPPRDPVVVTFDDGTADFVEVAVPHLVAHGVPATLYLATEFVEAGRSFWDDGTVLSWAALRDALSTGLVSIGSHTHSHLLLDRASPEDAAADLDRSVDLIADRLGVEARHFAYPKALPASGATEAEVRRRFASAAVAGGRTNRYGVADLHRLARTPVQAADGPRLFRAKAGGGLRLEGALREALDRRRYARATR
jgi:peptidoglycan/xylan/chitin deacetylase (PgdA/CDA1 family)